jgi:hypothetical protein
VPEGAVHPVHGALIRVSVDNPAYVKEDPNLSGELGIGVPKAITGLAVLDTGATHSCVVVSVAEKLSLLLLNAVEFRGVRSGSDAEVSAPQFTRLRYGLLRIEGVAQNFATQLAEIQPLGSVDDEPIIALLGRDVLNAGVLHWDGPGRAFHLEFPRRAPSERNPEP